MCSFLWFSFIGFCLRKPGMLQNLIYGQTFLWLLLKHSNQQMFHIIANFEPNLIFKVKLSRLLVQVLKCDCVILDWEGFAARKNFE